jgi:hypothetical protein
MARLLQAALAAVFMSGLCVTAKADDETRAILDKAIAASGGAEKLAKRNSERGKSQGTLEINGAQIAFTSDSCIQLPNKLRAEMQLDFNGMKIDIVQVLSGDKGWVSAMGQTTELPDEVVGEMKEALYTARLETLVPLIKEQGFTLTGLGESKVDDRAAVGVKVASAGHKDVELYFDKESGLLVKHGRLGIDSTMKEVLKETYYSDFEDVDGLKTPKKVLVNQDGKKFLTSEVLEIRFVDTIDEKEFEKPAGEEASN